MSPPKGLFIEDLEMTLPDPEPSRGNSIEPFEPQGGLSDPTLGLGQTIAIYNDRIYARSFIEIKSILIRDKEYDMEFIDKRTHENKPYWIYKVKDFLVSELSENAVTACMVENGKYTSLEFEDIWTDIEED